MNFKLKVPIYGFEHVQEIVLKTFDDNIIQISDATNEDEPFLTLINPFNLRDDYKFDISDYFRDLLDIKREEDLLVYCVIVLVKPITKSKVNFLAPFVFNLENKTAGQLILDTFKYTNFGLGETVENYIENSH